jgi:hypothetical protein
MTATVIALGLALSTRSWRGMLQRHCRDHVADVNASLLRDGLDAASGDVVVVILDDDTSWLSAPTMVQMRDAGVAVVGLFDPGESDGHGERHLQRLGVDVVLPCTIGTEELLEVVRSIAPDQETADRFSELVDIEGDRIPRSERQILAVGGPAGAGATEVSIAIAQLWGGIRPLLIDVDETNPSLARRLGLAIHPHIITAVEAHRDERNVLDGECNTIESCVARRVVGSGALPFDVIVGIASRDDWSLLRADDVGALVEELAARWSLVVARLGPNLEDLARHGDRYEVSRSIVGRATRIVGVCDGTSVGVLRFFDWLVDVVSIAGDTPIDAVVNRCPSSAAAQAQLLRQIQEIAGPRLGDVALSPRDRNVERAAWDAALVTRGKFLKSIGSLPFDSTVSLRATAAEVSA